MGYIFDKEKIRFRKRDKTLGQVAWKVGKLILVSLALSVFYYAVAALFFSTDTDRQLRRENKMYEKLYGELVKKEELVGDVVEDLRLRDNEIYESIFHSKAPSVDPISSEDLDFEVDSIMESNIILYAGRKGKTLVERASGVEENFRKIFSIMAAGDTAVPPMHPPLENLSYSQAGASIGWKINPFYKVMSRHNGIDLMAPQGEPVYASKGGFVILVSRSEKGLGNVVEINNGHGYHTRYCHLDEIYVKFGQEIPRGTKIGTVGISGNTYAPHLHYEMMRGDDYLDPVNYMFATLTPDAYALMTFMSSRTGQSMD